VNRGMTKRVCHLTLRLRWVFGFLVAVGLICLVCFSKPSIVLASVHTYPDPTRQETMYRSLQTFRDETNQAWQTVFYKRVKDGVVQSLHLRLVGFPGMVQVGHGRSLRLSDRNGRTWEAPDVFAESNLDPDLATNVDARGAGVGGGAIALANGGG